MKFQGWVLQMLLWVLAVAPRSQVLAQDELVESYEHDGQSYFLPAARPDLRPSLRANHTSPFAMLLDDLGIPRPTARMIPETVRVLVFPHWGAYSAPQGRESLVDIVTLQSTGSCVAHISGRRAQGTRFVIRYDDLGEMADVECAQPTKLVRPGMKENYVYRGRFELRPDPHMRSIQVVNVLAFEDYLKGVVPSEMPASWGAEALKAQSVAARTYAVNDVLAARAEFPDRAWDLDDTVLSQAYLGVSRETAATNKAVELTRGVTLRYAGEPIRAYFSADSGGYTEQASNEWWDRLDQPYLPSKPEVYDLSWVPRDWQVTVSLATIEARLEAQNLIPVGSTLTEIRAIDADRLPSGRLAVVRVGLKSGEQVSVRGAAFRYAVRLRSSLLWLRKDGLNYELKGWGFGHGVGLNQWGARVLDERKHWDATRILNFYYEGARLETER